MAQATREELQVRAQKDLGVKDINFTQLAAVFYQGRRLRAGVKMEITDKCYKQGISQLAETLGVDDPNAKPVKGEAKINTAQPSPSTSTSIEHVQRSRRFRQGVRVSDAPRREDRSALEELQQEFERYWAHVEANNPFRPALERRGSGWVYADPMIPGGVITISASEQQAYVKDPELSYVDRSDEWIGKLVKLLASLSFVAQKCPICELRLRALLKTKIHKLLDKEYRLPLAPQPPGVDRPVGVIKFKKSHDDCRVMHPEYVQVMTDLAEQIAVLKAMPNGPKRERKTKEVRAEFRARAKTVIRNTVTKLTENSPEQKVDMEQLRVHATAIVNLIEEDMSDG